MLMKLNSYIDICIRVLNIASFECWQDTEIQMYTEIAEVKESAIFWRHVLRLHV
jgi:hypothetical protein